LKLGQSCSKLLRLKLSKGILYSSNWTRFFKNVMY